ncbi:NAD(P)/FAD-dependent oxidoreductase [Frigoribacterium sp. VKM Ac-1396]|uniref:NAD(P)/FAD-dependent oxidoreductase n=1 Tax=Frigoribacterium sp. VKM Ac-1396 TaxID=2783821 RepID=UPI00188B382A|nr:NAD(P)/FAD-dependent oxidoreductase [Frigoribacterium sp. VKM Ac-1396]MBF4599279.1 NAD(P)/FAD-dependent oxidoreductase [Frigoribacterium sp. VKM Ac-1396]
MTNQNTHPIDGAHDVVVIGGGAAGLSGALSLVRARRDVLVVDDDRPRNAPADGVHAFLTRDGVAPRELTRLGRAEVEGYGGAVTSGTVTGVRRDDDPEHPFVVTVATPGADDREVRARRLLVTSGLVDELPAVDGLAERWGRDVVHCPYCHGWEVQDRVIGVLATSPFAMHQALLFGQWSRDIVLFTNDSFAPDDEQAEQLRARGVTVVDGPVARLRVEDDTLTGVTLVDGRTVAVGALAVMARVRSRAGFVADLGLEATEHPAGVGTHLATVEPFTGRSAVPGVWLAGNVTEPMAQVVAAAAAGTMAGAAINMDLITAEVGAAVAARRTDEGTDERPDDGTDERTDERIDA